MYVFGGRLIFPSIDWHTVDVSADCRDALQTSAFFKRQAVILPYSSSPTPTHENAILDSRLTTTPETLKSVTFFDKSGDRKAFLTDFRVYVSNVPLKSKEIHKCSRGKLLVLMVPRKIFLLISTALLGLRHKRKLANYF